ncbi:hypothetical protein [Rosistilla oblonga]|uniref:hypothetical protein n=1 Tax=Rosistilla oblonga TaxID=2527990 RepID=UPI003A974D6C
MKLLVQAIADNVSECWKIVDVPIVPRIGDQFWPQVDTGFDGVMDVKRVCIYETGLIVVECELHRSPFPWQDLGWTAGDWIDAINEDEAAAIVR